MDDLRERLAFLTDWIPDDVRVWAPPEVWWLAFLTLGLLALLLVLTLLKKILGALFRGKRQVTGEWEPELREDMLTLPLPNTQAAACVFHVPARLRLVVVAPAGKGMVLDAQTIDRVLERVVPGLGRLAHHDRPRIVLWPAPTSELGFAGSFHRATETGGKRDLPSCWVMLAGRARGGGETVFLGLALYTDEPTTLGRRNVDAGEWLEVLRL